MAERTGLFDPIHPVDYQPLTENTFNWPRWIEQETRRRYETNSNFYRSKIHFLIGIPLFSLFRLACQIFCQDNGRCIFMKRAPSLSSLSFNIVLPTPQACWNARTARECLHHLQAAPREIRLSVATKQIRANRTLEDQPKFETSSLGMFIILIGTILKPTVSTRNMTLVLNINRSPRAPLPSHSG